MTYFGCFFKECQKCFCYFSELRQWVCKIAWHSLGHSLPPFNIKDQVLLLLFCYCYCFSSSYDWTIAMSVQDRLEQLQSEPFSTLVPPTPPFKHQRPSIVIVIVLLCCCFITSISLYCYSYNWGNECARLLSTTLAPPCLPFNIKGQVLVLLLCYCVIVFVLLLFL